MDNKELRRIAAKAGCRIMIEHGTGHELFCFHSLDSFALEIEAAWNRRAPLQLMYEAWQAALASSATTAPSDLSAAILAEREACAKLCESQRFMVLRPAERCADERVMAMKKCANSLAEQIRCRPSAAALAKQVPAQEQDKGNAYADCCDTPHFCSAARRCTAKDGAK